MPIHRASAWLLFLLLSLALAPFCLGGGIEYPALGHFDVEEGSIELWFTPMVEDLYPKPGPKEYRNLFTLFQMQVPECFSMGCTWIAKGKQHGFHVSMDAPGRQRALLPVSGRPDKTWRPGERHHLAFTWRQRDMSLWLDGKVAGTRRQSEPLTGKMAGQRLVVGDGKSRDIRVIIHAVRLSSVARSESLLAGARPEPDIHTTLLDRFDDPSRIDASGRTTAQQASSLSGQGGATLKGNWRLVKDPSPGIALYRAK
jgi:hypothetical protein